ncbi:MAG: TonB-dependent receptor plug domain-containing protein, partial [Bacteroidales bacterium]|nr:TonB-dependent receptor plug domain-containing protein [Bacteroidales bacterium]
GYNKSVISNVLLTSGKEIILNVSLKEKAYTVDELIIRPEKNKENPKNEMASVSARSFSVEETERFAGSLGDPARMVANYAGVMTQNDSRNDIIIRGNSPSGVLWRLEGVEIPNPNHFGALGTTGGPVSMINNNLLTDSDFLAGAFPAEYGNATAGAFDLYLRSGNNQSTEFTGQVGFNGFEAGIEGPLSHRENKPNPSYLANFRYSTLEMMHDLGFSTGTGAAIPEYQDLTYLIDLPARKAGRFKIFGLAGNSFIALGHDMEDSTGNQYNQRGVTTDFGSDLFVTGLSHLYYPSEKSKLNTTLSWQKTGSSAKIDSLKEGDVYIPHYGSEQAETKFSFTTQFKHKINSATHFYIGLVTDFYKLSFADSVNSKDYGRFISLANNEGNLALIRTYGQIQHSFKNNLMTYSGLNLMLSGLNNQILVEPRLGMKYTLGGRSALSLGLGLHSQLQPKAVYFTQSYMEASDSYITTNENIDLSRSLHLVAEYDYRFSKTLRLKLESYYQYLFKVPVKESFPEFSMLNAGDQFGLPREDSLINTGTGRNYGIELTLEKFLEQGYYFLFTTSLFQSEYRGYDKLWRNTAFNGNFVFNLLGGYEIKLSEKSMLTFDVKTVFAGGKRYLAIDLEKSIAENDEIRDWDSAYDKKYDPYFRTDFRIGYKMNGRRFSQEWGIDLQNLTNYKSLFIEGYDAQKKEVYQVYQQGFVPMMLYRIQF